MNMFENGERQSRKLMNIFDLGDRRITLPYSYGCIFLATQSEVRADVLSSDALNYEIRHEN
jgi:hypothetical protein